MTRIDAWGSCKVSSAIFSTTVRFGLTPLSLHVLRYWYRPEKSRLIWGSAATSSFASQYTLCTRSITDSWPVESALTLNSSISSSSSSNSLPHPEDDDDSFPWFPLGFEGSIWSLWVWNDMAPSECPVTGRLLGTAVLFIIPPSSHPV
eukprot:CAMPEP_0114174486 /NCGR_PEP_ID=MMETSP0043_2-20121206/36433_1 /TAXON_ID=464988 /ORGANISM="Hemiselmis andersenii, Strain CCMP644" /LENGTH=147 /DNA_ID=CAMNT_0001272629 /DNA_START=145 /DNA_END=585 /DNA_ORIENTATION=-